MTSTLYTEYIIHCVKETRQVIGKTMVKLRLDHNNLDKAMADNPSVIECQHIAWCPVWWCQCICTHSVAWRVLLCPVWSMLGGRTEATAEAAQWPCPASQPLVTGWYSSIFSIIQNKVGQKKNGHGVRIMLCHTRFSLEFVLCADGEYVPTVGPSDGSEWCVESLPPPEAAEASGGRVSPRPWLCDQSPVLPLCSGSTHPLSSSRLASVTIGHQDSEDTGPAPSHQQGNNSESSSSIIHSPPASREPGTHH